MVNVPGGGGTVGLARFLTEDSDDAVLVTGLTMLDASFVHRAAVGLDQLTPIARLTAEYFVVAVPASSPYRTIDELRVAALEDGAKIAWAGGPVGGVDHVAAVLFGKAIDADPSRLVYVPFLTSQEAATATAEGRVSSTILSSGDLAAEAKAGRVRLLGVAAPSRISSVDAPALSDSGIALELANWRGLLARPGLPDEKRALLVEQAESVARSAAWRELLDQKGWQDAFLAPDAFGAFIRSEQSRVKAALKAAGLLKR